MIFDLDSNKLGSHFGFDLNEQSLSIGIVALLSVVLISGNTQLAGLVVACLLIVYIINMQSNCSNDDLDLIDFIDGPLKKDSIIQSKQKLNNVQRFDIGSSGDGSSGSSGDIINSSGDISSEESLGGTSSINDEDNGCGCTYIGELDDDLDADDAFMLMARRKFVETNPKGPDRDVFYKIFNDEFTSVEDKEPWWSRREN